MKSSIKLPKLSFNEFNKIDFQPYFPSIILDIIEHLTGYKIKEFAHIQQETKFIENQKKKYIDQMKEERNRDPANFKE